MFDSRMMAAAAGLVLLTLAEPACSQEPSPQPGASYPATGKRAPGLEPLDTAVVTMMARHGIPGSALAIAKDGKLVFARGYGWANLATGELVQPGTLFGLASLSKTITAVAILKLVEQGKLRLDDPAFPILDHIKPARGVRVDPRLSRITVRHLLNHSGGWDHLASGDPVNWSTQVNLQRGARTAITAEQLIAFTMGVPLDFEPGTDSKYSNFGYIVLGEVIARVSGQPYGRYVRQNVLEPLGLRQTSLNSLDGRYLPNQARRYLAGNDDELPSWQQWKSDAAGGWAASAVDMIRFLTALDGSRGQPSLSESSRKQMLELPPPLRARPDGTHVGLGWDNVVQTEQAFGYFKDGNWYGMRTFMGRRPNGVNWVILFNQSMQPDAQDRQIGADAVQQIRQAVERIQKYPEIDLFQEFR